MKKLITTNLLLLLALFARGQQEDKNIYWVGHSLISSVDRNEPGTKHVMDLVRELAAARTYNGEYYKHTIPGAPLGWNWGATPRAWEDAKNLLAPLITSTHEKYGTFNVMVITEGVNIESSYEYWKSSFYARKFFNAAKRANKDCRLYLYESWHHFHASDQTFADYYGPISSWDWMAYMDKARNTWHLIQDKAADPKLVQQADDYSYQGPNEDPGNGEDLLDIQLIPTGQVLQNVLKRLEENRDNDNWSYKGAKLKSIDFFANPYTNFPYSQRTKYNGPVDDIHPSHLLIYLNALTHFAIIYEENPLELPALNNVPENIATIMQEVVWNTIINEERTGLKITSTPKRKKTMMAFYPNPSKDGLFHLKGFSGDNIKVYNHKGKLVKISQDKLVDISHLPTGIYFAKVKGQSFKLVKR